MKNIKKTYFDKIDEMVYFFLNDNRINKADILSIIRVAGNKYAQKHGIDKAKTDLAKFKYNGDITEEWLKHILTVLNPSYLDFSDPVTGEFTTEAFMSIS